MASSNLIEQLESALEKEISGLTAGTILEPQTKLAERFGVSRGSIARALTALASRGKVHSHRGKGTLIGPLADLERRPRSQQPELAPEEKMFEKLCVSIRDGALRSGERLPLRQILAARFGVAPGTVTKVYQRLVRRGLSHRKGRFWYAGRMPESAGIRVKERPTIFIFEPGKSIWKNLATSDRTRSFTASFMEEALRATARVRTFAEVKQAGELSFSQSIHQVRRLIQRTGPSYRGTLLPLSPFTLGKCADVARALLQLGKPVVWFDRADAPVPRGLQFPNFIRCHFHEDGGIVEAAKALLERGHRRILYAKMEAGGWVAARGEKLRQVLRRRERQVEFIQTPAAKELMVNIDLSRLGRRLRELPPQGQALWAALAKGQAQLVRHNLYRTEMEPKSGPRTYRVAMGVLASLQVSTPPLKEFSDKMAGITPMMIHILEQRPTAVVSPNDAFAHTMHRWLVLAGIRLPDQLSLLSFDNSFHEYAFLISSIDWGFGHLGYAAFHSLMGDIPYPDSKRQIASKSSLVLNSTLGTAGKPFSF